MKSKQLLWAMTLGLIVFSGMQLFSGGIDAKAAQSMKQQGALLLDVREPEEFSAVHVQDAKLIPLGELEARLPEIATYKDRPIVVMCRSGHRSARAVSLLKEAGYSQVSNIKGGITAWEKDGLQVIRL
ncbi:MAG: rhodanese-like domain-containing protein [Gallionella sp.]|jgi:rhodanese-related sulfurtransferase